VAYSIPELSHFPALDTFVVATKACILPRIVPMLKEIAQQGTRIISCQNGLDNEEYLAEAFGPDRVSRIVVNFAGSQMGDGRIAMSFFNPPNYIGPMTAKSEPLARQLAEMMTAAVSKPNSPQTSKSTNGRRSSSMRLSVPRAPWPASR